MSTTPQAPQGATTREDFHQPDAWHMPGTYWFWHHQPTSQQIQEQVAQMRAAGFHSFQIQPRLAYPLEQYLDEGYLAACREAVDEAARHGMMVGIYDDYNWQTGHGAGRAVAGHDHLREAHMFWSVGKVSGGKADLEIDQITSSSSNLGPAGIAWHYEDLTVHWTDWKVVFSLAADATTAWEIPEARIVHADGLGCRIQVDAPDLPDGTEVTVFVAARSASSRLINFLEPEAVQRFIEAAYQPYVEALAPHLGTTVTYFFFDQPHPNYHHWRQHTGNLRAPLPYSADIAQLMRDRWGADTPAVLVSLLRDLGERTTELRGGFYEFFTSLAQERFLGAVRDWLHSHGLLVSGHEVLAHVGGWGLSDAFDGWDLRVNFGLDYFGIDSYRDLTGVDAQDSAPQLSAKLGDSVARSNGRSGAILEQYYSKPHPGDTTYSGHWGLTLDELRHQSVRHHLLGMRQLIFHGFYQTDGVDGDLTKFSNPRFDFPPGINYEPWFHTYHPAYAQESGRLSTFIDGADPATEVAVLYPLATLWIDGQNGPHAALTGQWCEALAHAGIQYHLIDESDLANATVTSHGALVLGQRRYSAVVLPGTHVLTSPETLHVLGALAARGGTVIGSGATPESYIHAEDETGLHAAHRDWAALVDKGLVHSAPVPGSLADLRRLIPVSASARAWVDTHTPVPLWAWVGHEADGTARIALFNDHDEAARVTVHLSSAHHTLEQWDPLTGVVTRAGECGDSWEVTVEPFQLLLVRALPAQAHAAATSPAPHEGLADTGNPLALEGPWTLELEALGNPPRSHPAVPIAPSVDWTQQGFDWVSGVGTYRTVVSSHLMPHGGIVELPVVYGSATVRLNGVEVGQRGWRPYRFTVPAQAVREGENELTVTVSSGAGNRYYEGTGLRSRPEASGLGATPQLLPFTPPTSVQEG